MSTSRLHRWAAMGLGSLALLGISVGLSCRAMAQSATSVKDPSVRGGALAQAQTAQANPPGGFGGGGERPGFPGGPGGPGGPPMMGMGMMGGSAMTATASAVYVLRGNTLYAFDARSLRLVAQAELPRPAFPGGPGGGPGRPGGAGGGDGSQQGEE